MNKTVFLFALFGSLVFGCKEEEPQQPLIPKAPVFGIEVVNTYPHDPNAFTQGLLYHQGFLYESTGKRGRSSLRKVELKSGDVVREHRLDVALFGEGLALWDGHFVQLTWQAGKAFVYQMEDFDLVKGFTYSGEGWGLTSNESGLVMSDGSDELRFLSPERFGVVKRLKVTDGGKPVKMLNELEFIEGDLYANVWLSNKIARIDPESGKVIAWFDLSSLVPAEHRGSKEAVLNGIAYDAENDRFFVTGKLWPKLYEIKMLEK